MDPLQPTPLPENTQLAPVESGPPIINQEAWEQLQALREHPLLKGDQRIVRTSIEGLEIDVMMGTYALKMRIAPLPPQEQTKILALHTAANQIKGKIGGLTTLAYGARTSMSIYAEQVTPVLDPRKAEIIELFGKMFTLQEVHEVVTKKWGYQLSIRTLDSFRVRHLSDIQARQEEHKRDVSNIRLNYKPARMEELSFIYNTRKGTYEENPSIANERQLQAILEQIRKEAEGEISTVNLKGEITVQTLMDPVMRKKMLQQLSVVDIVIGRVAARLQRNPQFLISRLQNSIYSKFTGMATESKEDLEATPIYPSQYIYDFDKIKANEGERKAEEKRLAQLPEVILEEATVAVVASEDGETSAVDVTPAKPKAKVNKIRERMLANLNAVKETVNMSADKINRTAEK